MERISLWELCEGNLDGGGSFIGDAEGYVEDGSGDGHLSPKGPRWGTREVGIRGL